MPTIITGKNGSLPFGEMTPEQFVPFMGGKSQLFMLHITRGAGPYTALNVWATFALYENTPHNLQIGEWNKYYNLGNQKWKAYDMESYEWAMDNLPVEILKDDCLFDMLPPDKVYPDEEDELLSAILERTQRKKKTKIAVMPVGHWKQQDLKKKAFDRWLVNCC